MMSRLRAWHGSGRWHCCGNHRKVAFNLGDFQMKGNGPERGLLRRPPKASGFLQRYVLKGLNSDRGSRTRAGWFLTGLLGRRSAGCAIIGVGDIYSDVRRILHIMAVEMAKAEIHAGVCGFTTRVEAKMDGEVCRLTIQSDCPAVQKMGEILTEVDPLREISARRAVPLILQAGLKHCTHAACAVPVGIIKAVEVEAGLALPKNVSITVTRE
jgi:hypothetical protein